jgi:hypothetical protein
MINLDAILGSEELNTLKVEATDGDISRIAGLANKQVELERKVEDLNKQLADAQKELSLIQEHDLPDAMAEAGITELKLNNGSRVAIQSIVGAHISKANAEQAHKWLDDNGHGGLIKRELLFKFNREDTAYEGMMEEYRRMGWSNFSLKEYVHPSTLKAFVKEQVGEGSDIPTTAFGIYTGFKSKITK